MVRNMSILVIMCFWLSIFSISGASAVNYDGIWFMGFNLGKVYFKDDIGLKLRKGISLAIDKKRINREFGEEAAFPKSIIPPSMEGYDESNAKYLQYNPALAIKNLKGTKTNVLVGLTLLHTDGLKTKMFAKYIKEDLAKVGVKVKLVEISYSVQDKWIRAMTSGKYDMFLLGYKAQDYRRTESLLGPIFRSKGEANFMFFKDEEVDKRIEKIRGSTIKAGREENLKKLNKYLISKYTLVPLFYIESL